MNTKNVPRYLILILSMFNSGSGSLEEYNNAKKFLPKDMPLEDYREALAIISDYIGIEGCSNVPYKEYLLSDWWRSRRMKAIRDSGFKCQQCNSRKRLTVHHLSYDNLWNERDQELLVLCRQCHSERHV